MANKVSALTATKNLRAVFGHPDPLDLAEQVNRPGSVTLVSLAVDELHGAGRMVGNIFLSSLCREVFARVRVPERDRVPIRLYVDEFEHFLRPDFETVLAEGRRFGLSAVLAHQTLSQLTPKMRSLVLGNVGVKAAFRCGREDAAVLSKDIAGGAGDLDLHSLAVGEALPWVRGHGHAFVEVNEPLFPNGLPPLDAYRDSLFRTVEGVRHQAEEPMDAEFQTVEVDAEQGPARHIRDEPSVKKATPLEDWL